MRCLLLSSPCLICVTGLGAVLAAAVVAGVLYAVLLKTSPGYALLVSLAAAMAVIFRGLSVLSRNSAGIADLGRQTDGQALLVWCGAQVLLLTDYARTLCEEAGADSLAWCAALLDDVWRFRLPGRC